MRMLEQSVREEPDEPFHLFNLGVALGHLGLYEEAEMTLKRAIKGAPEKPSWSAVAYSALSRAAAAQGKTSRAVRLATKATTRAPDWAPGWCGLGDALMRAGRLEEAGGAYAVALGRSPETSVQEGAPGDVEWLASAGLARIHLARGEYAEAAAWLLSAVEMSPANAELRVRLAEAYDRLGQGGHARGQLDAALAAPDAGPEAHAAFSDFFARRAEHALLRGLADHPENGALLERLEALRAAEVIA